MQMGMGMGKGGGRSAENSQRSRRYGDCQAFASCFAYI